MKVKFYEADGFVLNPFLMEGPDNTGILQCQEIRQQSQNKISSMKVYNNGPHAGTHCREN